MEHQVRTKLAFEKVEKTSPWGSHKPSLSAAVIFGPITFFGRSAVIS